MVVTISEYMELPSKWRLNYQYVIEYYKQNGNIDIPFDYQINNVKLGYWLSNQRKSYKNGKLSLIKYELLTQLGMKWDVFQENWEKTYNLLEDYYNKNGTTLLPEHFKINGVDISTWEYAQRSAYKGNGNCHITKERIKLLNDIEFDWQPTDTKYLNKEIDNITIYKKVMLERMKHILEDLSFEYNDDFEKKDIIEKIIKRMWK